ncbi:rho GTPase-activating protein [Mortierella sp. NVP85]|nr:rho GTPase-activating protein [Mortierella sp. NVP85]
MSSPHVKRDKTSLANTGQQEASPRKSVSNDGLQKQHRNTPGPGSGGSSIGTPGPSAVKLPSVTNNNTASSQGQSNNNGASAGGGGGGGVSAFSYFKARLFGTVADASTSLTSSARDLLQPKKHSESAKPSPSPEPSLGSGGKLGAPTHSYKDKGPNSNITLPTSYTDDPMDPPLSPNAAQRFFSRTLPSRRQQSESVQLAHGKQAKPTGHPPPSASESLSLTPTASSFHGSSTSTVHPGGQSRRGTALQSFTNAQKHLSTASLIYQEGYLNKKADLHSGETGHGWKVYKVVLKSSKLYFYKPSVSDERPHFHGPRDHRHHLSPNQTHRDHHGYHHSQYSSSSGIISPRLSVTNECGMVLSAFNFESSTRTLLFEGNAKSLAHGANAFAPPVSKYVYGECFTEIDRTTMQTKKYVALLLFEDNIVICKRKWIRYTSTKVKDVIKFSTISNEKSEAQDQASGKRQAAMSGISHKSADSRGSEAEQRSRSNSNVEPTEKQRGYFTKWKHEATYPLSQTTSTIELVITSVIDGNEYTHRLLYLPPSQEVRHHWYSKFNQVKELDQSRMRTASKLKGSVDNLVLKDTLSPRSAHSNQSTLSLHSPTSTRFHSEDGDPILSMKMDRTKAFDETSMHPELTFHLDEASGTEQLAGASINGLVHEIVHGNITNPHQDLVVMFARTYPLFTTLQHVLKELKRCINLQPSTASKNNTEKMTRRVESLVQEMLKGLGTKHTEPGALEELKAFTEHILRDKLGSSAAPTILATMTTMIEGSHGASVDPFVESPALSAQATVASADLSNVLITGLTPALLLKLEPLYFAEQVLRYHREQLLIAGGTSALFDNPALFMRQYPTAGANRSRQSSIVFSTYSPHFLTVLITHHILIATQSIQSTSRRPKLLTHWIRTAKWSRTLGDMAGFAAIALGICSPGVVRLQESWKHVPADLRLEVAQTWVPLLIKMNMVTEDLQELAISSFGLESSLNTVFDLSLEGGVTMVPCVCNIKQSIDQLDRLEPSFIQSSPVPLLNIEKLEHIHAVLRKASDSIPKEPLPSKAILSSLGSSHLQQYFGHLASISHTLHDQYHSNELSNDAFESSLACEQHFNGQYLDYHYKNRKLTGSFIPLTFPEIIPEKRLFPLSLLLSLEITGNAHRKCSFDEAQMAQQNADHPKPTSGFSTSTHGSSDWTDASAIHNSATGPGLASEFPKLRQRTYSFPPARTALQGTRNYSVQPMVNMINPHLDAVASGCLLSCEDTESNAVYVAMRHVAGIEYSTIAIEDGNLVLKVKEENLEALVKAMMHDEEEEEEEGGEPTTQRNTANNRGSARSSLTTIGGPRPAMVKAGTLENLIHVVVMGLEDQSGRYMDEKGDMIAWTSRQLTLDHDSFIKTFFATYRSFCTAGRLLEQIVGMFLVSQKTGSRLSKIPSSLDLFSAISDATSHPPGTWTDTNTHDWKRILIMQLNVLSVLEFWLRVHIRDFLDDLSLKAKLGEALKRMSTQEATQRRLMDETHSDKVQALSDSLNNIKRLAVQQLMKPLDAPNLGSDTIETFFGTPPSMVPQMQDDWSAEQILEHLDTAAWAHFQSVTEHEWFILFEVLESQSTDPLGWYLPKQTTTPADEDVVIAGIHDTLQTIRRNGIPGTSWTGERITNAFPLSVQNLCKLHHVIRSWTIAQIASPSISYDVRLDRMQKFLEVVLQSRRAMVHFGDDPSKSQRTTGASPVRIVECGVASFVEDAVASALISPESRAFSRTWLELASGRKGSIDTLDDVLALQREREILTAGSSGLKTSETLVPAIGWLIERMLEACCYVRDMSYESPLLVNFDKRQYIYDLVQLFVNRQEQLRDSERRATPTSSWLCQAAGPCSNPGIKLVREVAMREANSVRGGSTGQLSSAGNLPGRSSRQVKIFSRLVSLQHEKVKRDQKEYEKLEKEIKETHDKIHKAQQEQAKNLEKQIKLEQSRSRAKNQLLKSTLMRAMRPISLAITHSWSTATTTVSNATALGSAISGKVMGGTGVNGSTDMLKASEPDGHHSHSQPRPTSVSGSIYHGTNSKPVLVINLINATSSVAYTYTKRDFVFKIVTEEGGQSLLQALDYEDMHKWIKSLNDLAAEASAKRRTLLDNDESTKAVEQEEDLPIAVEDERRGRNTVFGVDLRHLMLDGNIPVIVEKCLEEIEKRGLEEVGIYRVPGSVSAINRLRQSFNSGSENVDLESDEWKDINVVAGALKQFLRELPEAVVSHTLYDSMIAAVALEDYDERLIAMKDLIRTLPPPNYILLKRIIEHLERITDFEEVNHMYAANLAIVFGPTLLRPGGSSANSFATSMKNLGHQQNIVRNMILQYHWLFDVEQEEGGEYAEEDEEHGEFLEIVEDSDEADYESDEEAADDREEGEDEDNKVLVLSAEATAPVTIDIKDMDKDKEITAKNMRRKTIILGM